jgi:nucleoside-diphosphate-sugar epimerase
MKVFVAGGTGVIGLPTVQVLVAAGHKVRATARGEAKGKLVRQAGAEPVQVDLYDENALRPAVRGCEAVVRLTTKIPSLLRMRSKSAWDETNRLRTAGAQCLVNAAMVEQVGVYVQESFFSVYADAGDRMVVETSRTDDGGLTTMRAALEGEQEARRFSQAGGSGISLRFGGYYGARVPSTQETIALVRKRRLPLIGEGNNFIPSLHIEDAAQAVVHSIKAPGGIYNVCDDDPVRWKDYLLLLAQAAGAPKPYRLPGFLGSLLVGYPWKWIGRSVRLSSAHFQSVTGWHPKIRSVREGWPLVTRELAAGANPDNRAIGGLHA